MKILILVMAAIIIAEFIYILHIKKEVSDMCSKLTKTFCDVVDGKNVALLYNESMLSLLHEKITRYIKANNSKYEALNAEKKNLQMVITNVAHQMVQPISQIHINSEMLMENNISDSDRKTLVNNINRQSNKLRFIFEVMMKSSRLETGLIKINNIKYQSVKILISNIIADLIDIIVKKDMEIIVDIPDDLNAYFDMKWTAEAVYNIVENAVKYTQRSGKITIRTVEYEMFVRLDIEDTGMGIAKNEYTDIFKRFYRSESVKNYNGFGVGLYLTREIIIREGGYVSVSSVIDKGSVFSVFIPSQK